VSEEVIFLVLTLSSNPVLLLLPSGCRVWLFSSPRKLCIPEGSIFPNGEIFGLVRMSLSLHDKFDVVLVLLLLVIGGAKCPGSGPVLLRESVNCCNISPGF
jgi:hypothetical protein